MGRYRVANVIALTGQAEEDRDRDRDLEMIHDLRIASRRTRGSELDEVLDLGLNLAEADSQNENETVMNGLANGNSVDWWRLVDALRTASPMPGHRAERLACYDSAMSSIVQ